MAPSAWQFAVFFFSGAFFHGSTSLRVSSGMWGPSDLSAVEKALQSILASKHLAPEQLKSAKSVAALVHKDILAVTSRNLPKKARKETVAHAIKLMMGLEAELNRVVNPIVLREQALEEQLAEKKSELAKDEAQLKLVKLEKELVEKKAELQDMTQRKSMGQAQASDAKERSAMVAKLVDMAKNLAASNNTSSSRDTAPLPPPLQGILSNLQSQASNISTSLAALDAAEQKYGHDLEVALSKKMPTTGANDAIVKSQAMIKRLQREEHHKFQKARAMKKNELTELNQAIQFIKKHDVVGLQKVLSKMNAESKRLQVRSGKFIY